MKIQIFEDSANEWRWHLVADNGRIVADSAEGYAKKGNAKRAIQKVLAKLGLELGYE
jgi:hypothetical protein